LFVLLAFAPISGRRCADDMTGAAGRAYGLPHSYRPAERVVPDPRPGTTETA